MFRLNKRHIAKTITWRLIGTLDTLIISLIITGKLETGLKIGISELITKMILYYAHERIWFLSKNFKSNDRHIIKSFTWRLIGTIDTFLLGWLFSGNPFIGLKIGLVEAISKLILYYLHEKLWYRFDFGLNNRKS